VHAEGKTEHMLSGIAASVAAGVSAGLLFDPLVASVTAAVSAALSGYGGAPRSRWLMSAAVVLAGWAFGDGVRIAGSLGSPAQLAAWALTGLAFGYVLPAVAGAYVGRQVHRGTGWLAAGAVALMLAPALSALGGALSSGLREVVPWRLL
jgi:hypothetical protein